MDGLKKVQPHENVLPVLAVVVPCYNEALVIEETARQLSSVLDNLKQQNKIDSSSYVYFVDDGSTDGTWDTIERLHKEDGLLKGLKLSRNTGHQNALLAGLMGVKERMDCVVSIDADLQDDISAIEKMVDLFHKGYEVIYGVRKGRDEDSFFKKYSALMFYKLMQWLGVNFISNHGDFRLASGRAISALSTFHEVNLFLRGIFPLVGLKSAEVYYDRKKRLAGESKYPFRKMLAFALDGITSFSIKPLRTIAFAGLVISLLSLILTMWALFGYFTDRTVPGWASTVLPIYFLGGLQLFTIGIIGEYIGKIYSEVKARPRFISERELF
jgi:glycosyltransferase involved in cell wall biosynthesis